MFLDLTVLNSKVSETGNNIEHFETPTLVNGETVKGITPRTAGGCVVQFIDGSSIVSIEGLDIVKKQMGMKAKKIAVKDTKKKPKRKVH